MIEGLFMAGRLAASYAKKYWPVLALALLAVIIVSVIVLYANARANAVASNDKAKLYQTERDYARDQTKFVLHQYQAMQKVMAQRNDSVVKIQTSVDRLKQSIAEANENAKSAYGICANVPLDTSVQDRIDTLLGPIPPPEKK